MFLFYIKTVLAIMQMENGNIFIIIKKFINTGKANPLSILFKIQKRKRLNITCQGDITLNKNRIRAYICLTSSQLKLSFDYLFK